MIINGLSDLSEISKRESSINNDSEKNIFNSVLEFINDYKGNSYTGSLLHDCDINLKLIKYIRNGNPTDLKYVSDEFYDLLGSKEFLWR